MMTADAVAHGLGPADIHGPEAFKQFHATFRNAFPNMHIHLEDLIAEGDKVAFIYTATGTHQGALMTIPATGKSSRFTGMGIIRIANGKVAEGWNVFDQLTMFQQLGVISAPA
jgi:steroid delta-isomerase-like uncharacterized protein